MKNLILLIMLLLTAAMATAQVAITQDTDGYTNVRKKPNGQAQVIHRLYSNEVFWYAYEAEGDTEEWVRVYIPKNSFSFSSNYPDYLEGFIHKSRLQPLEKLQPYKGTDIKFEYILEPFLLNNRIVDRYNGAVAAIAGRRVWGADGSFPKIQVREVKAMIEGKRIEINEALYSDIFECTDSFNVYRNEDTYFVYQWNSDGAGAYQVVWVFTKDGLKQRLVGSMI